MLVIIIVTDIPITITHFISEFFAHIRYIAWFPDDLLIKLFRKYATLEITRLINQSLRSARNEYGIATRQQRSTSLWTLLIVLHQASLPCHLQNTSFPPLTTDHLLVGVWMMAPVMKPLSILKGHANLFYYCYTTKSVTCSLPGAITPKCQLASRFPMCFSLRWAL